MACHFLFETVITLVICIFTSPASATLSKDECNSPECFPLLKETNFRIINKSSLTELTIFCHSGQREAWWNLWVNPHVLLKGKDNGMPPPDLLVFYGDNVSDVKHRVAAKPYFNWNSFMLLNEEYRLSPFNNSCIGFKSSAQYTVLFRIKNPDFWYITYVLLGIIIFFCAPSWSRNNIFHYGTGISFGVLASFLIVFFILSRLLPQRLKTVSYIIMLLSGSASLFMVQLVKNYLFEIIQIHWQLFLSYIGISALVSFIIVYRWGPITETRTLNLLCWILQALGLILIYQGTQIAEASVAIILLVITVYLSPRTVPNWIKFAWYRIFPPKVCLLTEDEYNREGEEETQKALKELREYCRSPQCNAWDTVGQLSSPSRKTFPIGTSTPPTPTHRYDPVYFDRFAKFIAGDSHVTDDEIEQHTMFVQSNDFSDIEDEVSAGGDNAQVEEPDFTHPHFSYNLPPSFELNDSDSDYESEPNNRYYHLSSA